MFTGLIETVGTVARNDRVAAGARIEIYAPEFGRDMAIGDSVAVDGACLTIVQFIRGAFVADVSAETLDKTTLGSARSGTKVNLERAMRASDRLGGHIVTGHIDGVAALVKRQPSGNSVIYQFRLPDDLMPYVAPKGSIALAGISLTVAAVRGSDVAVAVIPHTESATTLSDLPLGASVNVESDVLAKYVHQAVASYVGRSADSDRSDQGGVRSILSQFLDGK